MKLIFAASLVLFFGLLSAQAQSCVKVFGWAQQGAQVVTTAGTDSTTKHQRSYPSSTITVYSPTGTTTIAAIFSNATCSVVKANPFTASATDASYAFYITSSAIDIRFSGTGITTPFTLSDLRVVSNADASTTVKGLTKLSIAPVSASNPIAAGDNDPRFMYFNVKSYGAAGDGVTNDKAAIQTAINAAFANGGGRVYFPKPAAFYYVGGSLNATCNSLLCIPQNLWTGSTIVSIPIYFEGEAHPTWGDYLTNASGVTIKTDSAGSGTYPAILSAKAWQSLSPTYYIAVNYVDVRVENLRFATFNNPTIGGVNLMNANRGSVRNVLVDVNTPETAESTTAPSLPTNNVIGIAMPQSPNNGQSNIENSTVTGYKYGFYAGDHTRFTGFNMAARCLYGYWFDTMSGMGTGDLYSYRNLHTIKNTGLSLMNFRIQIESDFNSGTWTQITPGTTVDFDDSANNEAQGTLIVKAESPGGTQDYQPVITGMSKVDILQFNPEASNWKAFLGLGYQNGWSDYDGTLYHLGGYYKEKGVLHFKGVIKGGTIGSAAVTLPVGYRPPLTCLLSVISNGAIGRVDIYSDGRVMILAPSNNTYVSLDGASCALH